MPTMGEKRSVMPSRIKTNVYLEDAVTVKKSGSVNMRYRLQLKRPPSNLHYAS